MEVTRQLNLPTSLAFVFCSLNLIIDSQGIARANEIEFYEHNNFTRWVHGSPNITTSCDTLPQRYWNRVSSINNAKCVLLFTHSFCFGRSYRLEAGKHWELPDFPDDVDSYRSCDDVSKASIYKDYRVLLFLHGGWNDILGNPQILPGCVNLNREYLRSVSSLKTPICIVLFSQPDCKGESYQQEKGENGYLTEFDRMLASFKPCYADDLVKKGSSAGLTQGQDSTIGLRLGIFGGFLLILVVTGIAAWRLREYQRTGGVFPPKLNFLFKS